MTSKILTMCVLAAGFGLRAFSQTAQLSGTVLDKQGKAIGDAEVSVHHVKMNIDRKTKTNDSGFYVAPSLNPGEYRVSITAAGFKGAVFENVVLDTAQKATINCTLDVGSVASSVTVMETSPLINREDASVSTVADRQFLDSAPLNGRSLQSLFTLVPGIVLSSSNATSGQINVNGQRANSNYFLVDGIGGNIENSALNQGLPGQNEAGSTALFTVFGGTNSLASVDAIEQVKIQTSSFAPEFGRMPGGQISFVTRSGGNVFRGSMFEYLRNDALNANDWFFDSTNAPRAPLRQNQFGGTFSGPIARNRLFFFASYEGLRLLQPLYYLTNVPSLSMRRNSPAAMEPYLNAFPLPNGPDLANGLAVYNAGRDAANLLNAGSVRADYLVRPELTLFVRYNDAPSEIDEFAGVHNVANSLSVLSHPRTITVGVTAILSPSLVSEVRLNSSDNSGRYLASPGSFGGATPIPLNLLVPLGSNQGPLYNLTAFNAPGYTSTSYPYLLYSHNRSSQRQLNATNDWSLKERTHQLKWGFDFRRLSPVDQVFSYGMYLYFSTLQSVASATGSSATVSVRTPDAEPIFLNLSAYIQDSWHPLSNLTILYGTRWEYNPPPSAANEVNPYTVMGYDTLATMTLAPANTPLWKTRYNSFAPRVGVAYSPWQNSKVTPVVRAGFGVFYDTGQSLGAYGFSGPPFYQSNSYTNIPVPVNFSQYPAPPLTLVKPYSGVYAFDPSLRVPYTLEWNLSVESKISTADVLTVSYVGAGGRALLNKRTVSLSNINPLFGMTYLIDNTGSSNYDALQLKWVRRLTSALGGQAGYTWSHSIDNTSADYGSLVFVRGSSDFDVRQTFSSLLTYALPLSSQSSWRGALIRGWTLDSILVANTGLPLNITTGTIIEPDGTEYSPRPNVVPSEPFYIDSPSAPGGRVLNRAAFVAPPSGALGDLGRNVLRQFSVWQLDLGLRRNIAITERLSAELRLDAFNALNHPNFGSIQTTLTSPNFGAATNTLASQLGGTGLAPVFQVGGPRSLQVSIRLRF